MNHDKENTILKALVEVNKSASASYNTALRQVKNPRLERSFSDLGRLHSAVVSDICERIRDNGGDVHSETGSDSFISGNDSAWMADMMARVSNDVDGTLVAHLEATEDKCLHSMRDALEARDMQTNTRALLVSELGSLQRSRDYMKALKESMHPESRAA